MISANALPIDLLSRIRQEFFEMPGLCLTQAQARRLWQLDEYTCDAILAALVKRNFLMRTSGGAYLRRGLSRSRFRHVGREAPEPTSPDADTQPPDDGGDGARQSDPEALDQPELGPDVDPSMIPVRASRS